MGNYSKALVFVGSKLLKMMILVRLGDLVDEVIREEKFHFRKGHFRKGDGCIDQIFTLKLVIEKYLSR